jgi:hypothetical protein
MKNIIALLSAVSVILPPAANAASTAYSPAFTVDTRQLQLTGLSISGPPSVPWGSGAAYTATLTLQGGVTRDVTFECEWSVKGGPKVENFWEMPVMNGNVLDAKVASPTPVQISASFLGNTGRIPSAPLAVTVTESNGMNIGMSFLHPSTSTPHYIGFSGGQHGWRVVAEASGLAAMKTGVTFVWKLDGVQVGTGKILDKEIVGQPGTHELSVTATDSEGRVGQAFVHLVCSAPPGAGEPQTGISALDPGDGEVLDEQEGWFSFDPAKKANGLIILTHGLRGTGTDGWLKSMAAAIRQRLDDLGRPANIAIFGWGGPEAGYKSDPSKAWGYDAWSSKQRARDPGLVRDYAILTSDIAMNMVGDFILLRDDAQEMGVELANWIRKEVRKGNISTSAPLHLIGHSAGGFVMGECGWQVKSSFGNSRVTMLDTPFPFYHHLYNFPNPGRLDRYVSSAFGTLNYPGTLLASMDTSFRTYQSVGGGLWASELEHSYSHQWYFGTVSGATAGSEGFGLSPILSTGSAARSLLLAQGMSASQEMSALEDGGEESTSPLAGFSTFGNVSSNGGAHVLAEGTSQNAGLVISGYQFPPGTAALRFSFQFTSAGDGDFLSVFFGNSTILFTGKDMELTREEPVTVDVPVEFLAGQVNDLVFRLVSRGQSNAVIELKDIQAVIIEDIDQDGLSNAEEAAMGTSAAMADTDLDGLDDWEEIHIYQTDPLSWDTDGDGKSDGDEVSADTDPKDPNSHFSVSSVWVENDRLHLKWMSTPTRGYRVQRSISPGFEAFDVIAAGIVGQHGTTDFADPATPADLKAIFYRIQLEPTP